MVDPKRAAEILYKHFAELTTEQFVENLKRACPEVFEQEQDEQIIVSDFPKTEQKHLQLDSTVNKLEKSQISWLEDS
jgi:hypothetical protein